MAITDCIANVNGITIKKNPQNHTQKKKKKTYNVRVCLIFNTDKPRDAMFPMLRTELSRSLSFVIRRI